MSHLVYRRAEWFGQYGRIPRFKAPGTKEENNYYVDRLVQGYRGEIETFGRLATSL